MNNTDKLIDYLISNIESAKGFVAEQAPDVARQILEYGFWHSLMYFAIGISILIFTFTLLKKLNRLDDVAEDDKFFIGIFVSLLIIPGLIMVFSNASSLIKIKTAPKLYILEKMKEVK